MTNRLPQVADWRLVLGLVVSMGIIRPLPGQELKVGSKAFTESVILGEICTQLILNEGVQCEHVAQLGGTQILWNALKKGEIHVYPDYTGTLTAEILNLPADSTLQQIATAAGKSGIGISQPLGFNNSYAIGMLRSRASELKIRKLSELSNHPQLTYGFSNEFMDRADGWIGLSETYRIPSENARGIEHALAYRAVESQSVDAIDLYTTDAEIALYDLVTLDDDQHFFPTYQAVLLYRLDIVDRFPNALPAISKIEGAIDETQMQQLNKAAKVDKVPEPTVANTFLRDRDLIVQTAAIIERSAKQTRWSRFQKNTIDHLILVGTSLFLAVIVAIPLGILAFKWRIAEQPVLAIVGLMQTIPSLALLVVLIPLFGLGTRPALVALFLYSLLPIVRNTVTGLGQIADDLRETAELLGLTFWQRLFRIELPIATPSILAGIKTAAVINVGTATIGALIGAGGYGQPIVTGIRLDDMGLIMEGAIPAAGLAILLQLFFERLEAMWLPRGLKIKRS